MSTTKKITASAVLMLAVALTLSACAGAQVKAGAIPSGAGSTSTPTATAPVAKFAAGAPVDATQAKALPAGQLAYPLPDGTLVVVQADQPLPAPVTAAIIAPVNALVAELPQAVPDYKILQKVIDLPTKIDLAVGAANKATGKTVIVIYNRWDSYNASEKGNSRWFSTARASGVTDAASAAGGKPSMLSKDAAIAATKVYVAAQTNPSNYEIIVTG